MEIQLTDLAADRRRPALKLEAAVWSRALKFLKSRKLLPAETLRRLEESPGGVQVTEDAAQKLAWYFIRRVPGVSVPPQPAVDWGPIATLNGVWIDPELAVREAHLAKTRKIQDDALKVAIFFMSCRGFQVN